MPKAAKKYRLQACRREWEKESWARGWLKVSTLGPEKAFCELCNKNLSAGKSELMQHTKTALHIKNASQLTRNCRMDNWVNSSSTCTKTESNAVALIARQNISLKFMDHLVPMLKHVASDSKSIKDMTCGRTKATYLLTECLGVSAHEALLQELKEAKGFSILCDKATDIIMNKIFCINVRYIHDEVPKS